MTGKNKTRLVGWHPSDPALVARLDTEIERRGGRATRAQSAILNEALTDWLDKHAPSRDHRGGADRHGCRHQPGR